MLTEMRIYTCHAGRAAEFAELYRRAGLAVQLPIGGRLEGFYRTEVGDPNRVILIWEYESYEDRAARRAKLAENRAGLPQAGCADGCLGREHDSVRRADTGGETGLVLSE